MTSERQEMARIGERLAKVERTNRVLAAALTLVAAAFAAAVLMGAASSDRKIEAERFIFRDKVGTARIVLETTAAGPTVSLNDVKGQAGVRLVINDEGYFQVQMPKAQQPGAKPVIKPGTKPAPAKP